jgi:hypothetical protein
MQRSSSERGVSPFDDSCANPEHPSMLLSVSFAVNAFTLRRGKSWQRQLRDCGKGVNECNRDVSTVGFSKLAVYTLYVNRAPDRPHSKHKHVYPIARINIPFNQNNPSYSFSVVKVLMSQVEAEAEVSRLSQVNAGKGCVYLCCTSRLIEDKWAS